MAQGNPPGPGCFLKIVSFAASPVVGRPGDPGPRTTGGCSEKSPCTTVMGASTGASAAATAVPLPARRAEKAAKRKPPSSAGGRVGTAWLAGRNYRGPAGPAAVPAPAGDGPALLPPGYPALPRRRPCPKAGIAPGRFPPHRWGERQHRSQPRRPRCRSPAPSPPAVPAPLLDPLPPLFRLLSSVSAEAPRRPPATARLAAPGPASSARLGSLRRGGRQAAERRL